MLGLDGPAKSIIGPAIAGSEGILTASVNSPVPRSGFTHRGSVVKYIVASFFAVLIECMRRGKFAGAAILVLGYGWLAAIGFSLALGAEVPCPAHKRAGRF